MRKKILHTIFILIISPLCISAQIIKVSNGLSLSSIKTKVEELNFLSENRYDYSGFVGLNYCDHKYFYLSSEIGYASKGGRKKAEIYDYVYVPGWNRYELRSAGFEVITRSTGYLHLNTTFRLKYLVKNYSFYAGIGPKIDFLMGNDVIFNDNNWVATIRVENTGPPPEGILYTYPTELVQFKNYTFNKVLLGLKPEIGFDYCFSDRYMLGINASYHINANSAGKCNYLELENNRELAQKDFQGKTFLFMLTLGYKLI